MPASRVLIVDHDRDQSSNLAAGLASRNYEVGQASSAEEALRIADDSPPGVIILNAEIPSLDVSGFVRSLRTHPQTALVPVLFLSAKETVEDKITGFQLGSDDFLPKPVDPRELELHVAVALKIRSKMEMLLKPQAPDNADFSTPNLTSAFRGTLDQVGLPTILSLLDMERKTGMLVLILEPSKEKARLYFHDGRVIRASYDKRDRPKNAELVYELLSRPEGKFEFRNVAFDPRDEINTPTLRLLLEGARLIDEGRRP